MTSWILSSSILIAVTIGLRFFLHGRIAPGLQYGLWLIVLVRLLIPGSLFPSSMSVENLLPAPSSHQSAYEVQTQSYEFQRNTTFYSYYVDEYVPLEMPTEPQSAVDNIPVTPKTLWLIGVSAVLVLLLWCNLSFYRRLRRSRQMLNYDLPVPVYATEGLPSPCLFGIPCPAIYLPASATEDPQTSEHILAHELAHYRHGDHLWSLLRSVALAFHWYNPLVWAAVILSRQDAELACDSAAIRRLGEDQRLPYGRTLLQLVTAKPRPADLLSCATTMSSGKRSLTQRIRYIARTPKMMAVTLVCVLLVSLIAAGCTLTGAKEDQPEEAAAFTVDADTVTMFHHNLDTLTLRGDDVVDTLEALYSNQELRETNQPMDTLHRITVHFQRENGTTVAWSVTPDGVCSSSERKGNYIWKNNGYDVIADLFWDSLYCEKMFLAPMNLSKSVVYLENEEIDGLIRTFRGMELTQTSNEPDYSTTLSVVLEPDLAGQQPVTLFTIDAKGEVILDVNSGDECFYMCENGEELYQQLWSAYQATPKQISAPQQMAENMLAQAVSNFEQNYNCMITEYELVTFSEIICDQPDTKLFFAAYRIKPEDPDSLMLVDGMELSDGWIQNGDTGPLYLVYQKNDSSYEFCGAVYGRVIDQTHDGDLNAAVAQLLEDRSNKDNPFDYVTFVDTKQILLFDDRTGFDGWLYELTGLQKNGQAYYEILTNKEAFEYDLTPFDQVTLTTTCQDPDDPYFGDICVMSFPTYEETSSGAMLSRTDCVELLRTALIEAYEVRFGIPYEPLDAIPVSDFSEQNVMRYQINTLSITRAVGRFYVVPFQWNFFVDFYTGEIYLHYHGLDQSFTRFDPTSPSALMFAG